MSATKNERVRSIIKLVLAMMPRTRPGEGKELVRERVAGLLAKARPAMEKMGLYADITERDEDAIISGIVALTT